MSKAWLLVVALLVPAALLPLRAVRFGLSVLPLVYFVLFAPSVALLRVEGAKARAVAFFTTLGCQLAVGALLAALPSTPEAALAFLTIGILEPLLAAAVAGTTRDART